MASFEEEIDFIKKWGYQEGFFGNGGSHLARIAIEYLFNGRVETTTKHIGCCEVRFDQTRKLNYLVHFLPRKEFEHEDTDYPEGKRYKIHLPMPTKDYTLQALSDVPENMKIYLNKMLYQGHLPEIIRIITSSDRESNLYSIFTIKSESFIELTQEDKINFSEERDYQEYVRKGIESVRETRRTRGEYLRY